MGIEYENEKKGLLVYGGTYRVESHPIVRPIIYLKGRRIKLVPSNQFEKIFYIDYDNETFQKLQKYNDVADIKIKIIEGKKVIKINAKDVETAHKIAQEAKKQTYEVQFQKVKYFRVKNFRPYFYVKYKDGKKFRELMDKYVASLPENERPYYDYRLEVFNASNGKFYKVIVTDPRKVRRIRQYIEKYDIKTYEADVAFVQRYLIDKKFTIIKPLPKDILYYDIEIISKGGSVPDPHKAHFPVVSIAYYTGDGKKGIFILPNDLYGEELLDAETKMLHSFFKLIDHYTTIAGWNNILFDWPYLLNRAYYLNERLIGKIARKIRTYLYETYVYTMDPIKPEECPWQWKAAGKRGEEYRYIFYTYSRNDEKKVEEYIEKNFPETLTDIRTYRRRDYFQVISKIKESDEYKKNVIELPYSVSNVDVMQLYKKLVNDKLPTYKLDYVAQLEGFEGKVEFDVGKIEEVWRKEPEKLIEYNMHDAELVLKIDEKRDLVRQLYSLAELTSAILKHFHNDKRAIAAKKLIDTLVLSIAKEDKIVLPSGPLRKNKKKNKKYSGGYVHPPKKGVHFIIGVLDFNSLYPSIIRAFNISPETWRSDDSGEIKAPNGSFIKKPVGLLVKAVNVIFDMKMAIKRQLKEYAKRYGINSPEYRALKSRYQAVKGVLNSTYGVTGYEGFRLYKKEVAENITTIGRTIWHKTKEFAEQLGYTVVYGDSVTGDSVILVRTPNRETRRIKIEKLFTGEADYVKDGKEYKNLQNYYTITLNENGELVWRRIKYVMRHKTMKGMYMLTTESGKSVKVTEDHSVFVLRHGKLTAIPSRELKPGDMVVVTDGTTTLQEKIKKIEYTGITSDYVYDIEVDDTHKFFANGILVHNTDSQYYVLKSNNPEDAVKELEWLADKLTKMVQEYVTKEFNALGEYFRFDPDEIFKVLGLISKKNYAGYVIYKDGQILDEPEFTYAGLLSRGDVSDAIKKFLFEVIQAILLQDKDPWKVIERWHKEVLEGKWDNEVIIWKSLNKSLDEYESIQPHVRAYRLLLEKGVNPIELTKVGFVKVGKRPTDIIPVVPGETVKLTQTYREFVWENQFVSKIKVIEPILPKREEKSKDGRKQATLDAFVKK